MAIKPISIASGKDLWGHPVGVNVVWRIKNVWSV